MKNSILKSTFEEKLVSQNLNDEQFKILSEKVRQEKERLLEKQKVIKTKQFQSWRMKNAK